MSMLCNAEGFALQGQVAREREKVMMLKQRLTDLEAAYHSTLDSLDQLQTKGLPNMGERLTV